MYEFIVREFTLHRQRGYNVVQVRLDQVLPRTTPERGEMTLYFLESDPEVARFYYAARTREPIKVAFPQEAPPPTIMTPDQNEVW